MANEFVIKNGFFSQGTSNVTGNLTVTQTISGTTAQFTVVSASILSASSLVGVSVSANPGGTNQTIQFNSGSTFSGSTNLIYSYNTNTLSGTVSQFTQVTASFSGNGASLTNVTASAINDTTGSFSISNVQDGQYLKRSGNSIVGSFIMMAAVGIMNETEVAKSVGTSNDTLTGIYAFSGTAVLA